MIFTVTLNPALDKTVEIPSLTVDKVNRIITTRTDPGGKGINVSKVIEQLGSKSIATGILGGETGRSILSALEKMGIASDFLFTEGETRTNLKIIDPVCQTNTDINEPGITVNTETLNKLKEHLLEKIQKDDIVILSGSLPKGAPEDTYYHWVRDCKQAGAKVFLDADGAPMIHGIEAGPYLIKPNNYELSSLMQCSLETPKELAKAAQELIAKGVEKVVVSMGGNGALYVTKETVLYAEGLSVPVRSTVGAGDSVVASLAVAEETNITLEETARLSTATGAANVMCDGTQAAEYAEIKKLIPKVRFQTIE